MNEPVCKHNWKENYMGFKCNSCGEVVPEWYFDPELDSIPNDAFYPEDNYYFDDWEDEEYHSLHCICEDCIQNYPERLYLLEEEE